MNNASRFQGSAYSAANTHSFCVVDGGGMLELSHFFPRDVIEDPYLTPGWESLFTFCLLSHFYS